MRSNALLAALWLFVLLSSSAFAQVPSPQDTTLPSLDRALSLWRGGKYPEANAEFKRLVSSAPTNPDYKVQWGRLFLDRHNRDEAVALFQEALRIKDNHAGALLGLALVAEESNLANALELAERAIAADASLREGRELLSRLALQDGDLERATLEAQRALSIDPDALSTMSLLATIDWLSDRRETQWADRILQQDSHFGELYQQAGRSCARLGRYEEAIAFYQKGVTASPELWGAHAELGQLLFRVGRDAEARRHLERAFKNDPFDVVTYNTLHLMDRERNFATIKSDKWIIRIEKGEAQSQRLRIESELKRVLQANETRFGMVLSAPVAVKVYGKRDDFSVFAVGLPGIDALGSTYERTIAIDSSEGRLVGTELWARTLWWQVGVAFVKAATKNISPAWFVAGMAETGVPASWRSRPSKQELQALALEGLATLNNLSRALSHRAPESRRISLNALAGSVCDFIVQQWGGDKLKGMILAFARGQATSSVFEDQLGIGVPEFESRFVASLMEP